MLISLAIVSHRSSFLPCPEVPLTGSHAVLPAVGMNRIHGTCLQEKAGVAVPEALAGSVGLPVCPNFGFCRGRKYRWGGWVRETNFRSP